MELQSILWTCVVLPRNHIFIYCVPTSSKLKRAKLQETIFLSFVCVTTFSQLKCSIPLSPAYIKVALDEGNFSFEYRRVPFRVFSLAKCGLPIFCVIGRNQNWWQRVHSILHRCEF